MRSLNVTGDVWIGTILNSCNILLLLTTLCLQNIEQVPLALSTISKFSKVSGLKLNVKKCEILPLKDSSRSEICNISLKNTITYLGIKISRNP